jgi:hypothetical protein
MRTTTKRVRSGIKVLLCAPLLVALGCGGDGGRPAGSLDIPKEAMRRFPKANPMVRAGKAPGAPARTR